jgi:hypothetical protein
MENVQAEVAVAEKKKRNSYRSFSDEEVLTLASVATSLDNLAELMEMPKANVAVRLSTMRKKKGLTVPKFSRKGVKGVLNNDNTSTPNTGDNNNGTESKSD